MNKLTLAGCIILNEEGKVLLIHRNTEKRVQWETPGGKIEEGEDPRKTAQREAEEEIGVKVEIIKELGQKEFREDDFAMDYIWYLAKIISGKPQLMEKDSYDNLGYFSWQELQQMDSTLSGNTKNLVQAYSNQEFSLTL